MDPGRYGLQAAMTTTELPLIGILRAHAAWLEDPAAGRRADLSDATLNDTDLSGVVLARALLIGTTFLDANLARGGFEQR